MLNIGENIKNLRKKSGLSQSGLAELLGVSRSAVSSWEINRNEPNIGDIEKMASIFQCLKTDIIGKDNIDYLIVNNKEEKLFVEMYRALPPDVKAICLRELTYYYTITKTYDGVPEIVPLRNLINSTYSEAEKKKGGNS